MHGRAKAGGQFGGQAELLGGIKGRAQGSGRFLLECHGPVDVTNRRSFRDWLVARGVVVAGRFSRLMTDGQLWLRELLELSALKLDGWDEVERLYLPAPLLWADGFQNIIVDEGLTDICDKYYAGSAYTAAHYCLLTGNTPNVQPGDTMATHGGWTEVTAYSEATRPVFNWGAAANKSINNNSNKALFSINADGTDIGGACGSTNNTKGGSTGLLHNGGALAEGNRTLNDGETLSVGVTMSQADDGV